MLEGERWGHSRGGSIPPSIYADVAFFRPPKLPSYLPSAVIRGLLYVPTPLPLLLCWILLFVNLLRSGVRDDFKAAPAPKGEAPALWNIFLISVLVTVSYSCTVRYESVQRRQRVRATACGLVLAKRGRPHARGLVTCFV